MVVATPSVSEAGFWPLVELQRGFNPNPALVCLSHQRNMPEGPNKQKSLGTHGVHAAAGASPADKRVRRSACWSW